MRSRTAPRDWGVLARDGAPATRFAARLVRRLGSAFIGGIMSDFGFTGGDVFVMPVRGGKAVDRTPRLAAGAAADALLNIVHRLPSGSFSTGAARWTLAADDASAVIVQDFTRPSEIATGALAAWRPLTSDNAGVSAATRERAVTWHNEGYTVAGWLLEPLESAAGKRP
jgi:hypothetical protein